MYNLFFPSPTPRATTAQQSAVERDHGEKFVANITRSVLLFHAALRTKFAAAPCDFGMEL